MKVGFYDMCQERIIKKTIRKRWLSEQKRQKTIRNITEQVVEKTKRTVKNEKKKNTNKKKKGKHKTRKSRNFFGIF